MDDQASTRIAQELQDVTELGLTWLRNVLTIPLDEENGHLLRAQGAATAVAINAQLRADAMRMRAMREDKALSRLIGLIQERRESVPDTMNSLVASHSQLELSSDEV